MIARRDLLKFAALPYVPLRAAAQTAPSFPTQIATQVLRARRTPAAHRSAWSRVARRRSVCGGTARGTYFRYQSRTGKQEALLPGPRRAAAWHRLGPGRLPLVRREHLPVLLQNGPGHGQDS